MIYHNHRTEPYFSFLKSGQKTIEGRIRKGKYSEIVPGDEIIVSNDEETESVRTRVLRVTKYLSIREMLRREPIKKLLPDIGSIGEAVGVYRRFYTPEQERQFGVVAIEVELMPGWFVYVLRSLVNGKFYTGNTGDLERRLIEHNSGRGGRFTRLNKPFELVYKESFDDKYEAKKRERELKTGKGRYYVKKMVKNR